jgi:hypothetical protein
MREATVASVVTLLTRMFNHPSSAAAFVAAGGCGLIVSLLSTLQVTATVVIILQRRSDLPMQPHCFVAASSLAAALLKQPSCRSCSARAVFIYTSITAQNQHRYKSQE